MKHTIVLGSCESMIEIEDESIGCIFTSPPYALAKDYGDTGGIGMSSNIEAYKEYLTRMKAVLKECYRVLKPGRYIGVNIADVIQTHKNGTDKKPIRFNYYIIMKKIGFEYCDVIQWVKPSGMSNQKRFGVFIQHPHPLYYHPNNMYEPIIVMKKPGKIELSDKQKADNTLNWEHYKKYQSDLWEICPESNVDHPAPYPVQLPKIFIALHSLKGDTILDPFLGSGTTSKAGIEVGHRNTIGFEINPDYIKLIKKRINFGSSLIGDKFEVIERK